MKGFSDSSEILQREITRNVRTALRSLAEEKFDSQNAILGQPGLSEESYPEFISFKSNKFLDLITYLCILEGLKPRDESYLIQVDLEVHLKKQSQFYWLESLLREKLFIEWLQRSNWISKETFFGNILHPRNIGRVLKTVIYHFEREIVPKREQRKRGYRDKGTLVDPSTRAKIQVWLDSLECRSLLESLDDLEQLRRWKQSRLKDYLQGTGSLTDEELYEFRIERKVPKNENDKNST